MSSRLLARLVIFLALSALICASPAVADEPPVTAQAALGSAFTYQGYLEDGNRPANGVYDFSFDLYNVAEGGTPLTSPADLDDVTVSNGHFTVLLDFGGAVFDGEALWLQVYVRPGASDGEYTAMSPRTPVTATPFALSLRWGTAMSGTGVGLTVTNDGSVDEPALRAVSNYTAIEGLGTSSGIGIYGSTNNGVAVRGEAFAGSGTGVYGSAISGVGVEARSFSGVAIRARGTGVIQSSADSYVFVPGSMAVMFAYTTGAELLYWGQGHVTLHATAAGEKQVIFPLLVPAVLYGQQVQVEEIALGYVADPGTEINRVQIFRSHFDGTYETIWDDDSGWASTSWSHITANVAQSLASENGQMAVRVYCDLPVGGDIQFNGLRVKLGHE